MSKGDLMMFIDVASGILIAVASPIILGFIYSITKMVKKDRNAHSELKSGIGVIMNSQRSLLRSQILQMYEVGVNNNGMTLMQKSTIDELYKDYKALGGNGFVEDIMHKVHKMDNIG